MAFFHFNLIVEKRSVFYCVHVSSSACMSVHEAIKYSTFRYDVTEEENGLYCTITNRKIEPPLPFAELLFA